jgi:periplasmic divalent cation tolerance protein
VSGSATSQVPALVWCPFPDAESAEKIAGSLLDEGLIACANILPGMVSHYVWNGERGTSAEAGVLFKTNAAALAEVTSRLSDLHPYDEPAILGWQCDAASPGTATWLETLGR